MNFDIVVLLILNAIICAIYYGFLATISTLFDTAYPLLTETSIGLCFLGIGGGMAVGGWINGMYLDWEYKKVSRLFVKQTQRPAGGLETKGPVYGAADGSFPIEKVSALW